MELDPEQIKLWFHYEQVAMHFNDLIIRYRLQLMGGVGAIAVGAGYLITEKAEVANQPKLWFWVSMTLFVMVTAAAILDIFYYNRLLEGAVIALLEYERNNPNFYMSTRIHQRAGGWNFWIIVGWYASILLPISLFGLFAWRKDKAQVSEG